MEGPGVDPEAARDLAQGVVAGSDDDRTEVGGIVGDHQLAVGHEQPGQAITVPLVSGGGVLGGEGLQLLDGGAFVPRSAGSGHERPSLRPGTRANCSAKDDISSWMWARSSLIDVETTRRVAPAERASSMSLSVVVGR